MKAGAKAHVGDSEDDACVLALDPSASAALSATGDAQTIMQGCDLIANSDAPDAIKLNGTFDMCLRKVGAVGGIDHQNGTLTPLPPAGASAQELSEEKRTALDQVDALASEIAGAFRGQAPRLLSISVRASRIT